MAQNVAKFSQTNLPVGCRVDVDSLSQQAARHPSNLNAPALTQATTTEEVIAVAQTSRVRAAYLVYPGTVPACSGGTATLKIEHIAADGSTAVSIVDAVTVLSGLTTQVPLALTLATTNPTSMAAGGSIMASVVTSNNSVGAAGTGGKLTLLLEAVEPASISV